MRQLGMLAWAPLCVWAMLAVGCNGNAQFMTPERKDKGLVVILPGIEGVSGLNLAVRDGLVEAGCDRAVAIWSWGRPVPLLGFLFNQVDFLGNRLAGASLANRIKDYQKEYPGRPVHVIGHSGGGGIAVFVAEGMGEGHKIDGLVLLSASISSAYDLTKALRHCRSGIVNFYSRDDVGLLGVGTVLFGTVDGTHGLSAGLVGFDDPGDKEEPEKLEAYSRLYQVPVDQFMLRRDTTTHAGTTDEPFIVLYVHPWVEADFWPADDAEVYARTPTPSRDQWAPGDGEYWK